MTVNIVFGNTADGYVTSTNATYTTARNGSNLVVTGGTAIFAGQNTSYQHHQGFIGFNFAAVTGAVVASAVVRLSVASVLTPATARHLEIRNFNWSASGLQAADFRNATDLAAAPLFGQVTGVHNANGKFIYAGSDELRLAVESGLTSVEFVVVTDRQRAGTVPTVDEALSLWSADMSGTVNDPALVFTTVPRTALFGVLGAHARLSDGTSVYLESDGAVAPTINLRHQDHGFITETLGSPLPLGTGAATFAVPTGLQGLTLAVGADDSIYVIGRQGNAENSIRVRTWARSGGSWTLAGEQSFAMMSHDAAINQVAACVLNSHGLESLVILAAHTAGTGVAGSGTDISFTILNTSALKANSGTFVRWTTSAGGNFIFPSNVASTDFNAFANEVGTMLDLVADPYTPGQAYAISAEQGQTPGDNDAVSLSRIVLQSSHAGLSLASWEPGVAYLEKNSGGKARLVPVGPGVVAVVTADADTGYGLTVVVQQHTGTDPGSINLGYAELAAQGIPSMPDGPDVADSAAWDAVYDASGNALWIYYVDVADPTRLMRTSVDMSTYLATGVEREVFQVSAGSVITGVRTGRGGVAGDTNLVQIAFTSPGPVLDFIGLQDSFNLPPLAPTLNPRDGFDATLSATVSWIFNDPNSGDTQSAYRVQIEVQDTGVSVVDTGKVVSGVQSYTIPAGTLANAETYRWRVQTWDAEDEQSPWSDWGVFQTAAGGTVTITLPATDNIPGITSDDVEVRWAVAGTVQTAYRVWLYRTGSPEVLVSDSGWVTSTSTGRVVSGMLSDREHRVEVQVRNAANVTSNIGTRLITPSYGTPEMPEVTVSPVASQGYTLIQVRNPLPGEPGTGFPLWDFEVPGGPPAGWSVSMGTAEQSVEQAHDGTGSAKLTATGGESMFVRAPSVEIVPGQRYTLRAWVFRPVAGSVSMGIDWLTSGGAFISSSSFATTVSASTWTEVFASGTAPDTAGRASYGPGLTGPPAAGTVVYVDDMILTVASDRPDVAFNYVLRRRAGSSDPWEQLGQCPPDGEFRDYTAAGRTPYEYMVRGVSA
jgi:hypothetical protein